jgi:cold-inducible RNA-binding protein
LTKLYVGNLPYSMTDQSLAEVFAEFGPVASASVIMDRMSGRSKGFGFVEIEDDSLAQKAIEKLNNTQIEGRNILVSVARPMEERPQRSGGFNRGKSDRRF